MKKLTQKELVEDFHKKLALWYYEWSILFHYYHDKLYKSGGTLSTKDKRKLKQDSNHVHKIVKRMINEDFSSDIEEGYEGEYRDIKKDADGHFKVVINQNFETEMMSGNDDLTTFVKSIGKEKNFALLGLIEVERNEREALDSDSGFSFIECAEDYKRLSIIYNNYDEIVKILDKEKFVIGNVHYLIEIYKDIIVRVSAELLIKWVEKTKIIKRSRIGGRQPIDKKGYYLAIKAVLNKIGSNASAQQIWEHFRRKHNKAKIDLLEKEPMFVEEYQIWFERNALVQKFEDKERRISKKVVSTYLTEIRPVRKK